MIDFLIVGSGLFGSVFARKATDAGYSCLVLEKRRHIGGNCFTEKIGSIDIHKYGPHIFHTSNSVIWDFVNTYATFNSFINRPKALYDNKLYSLPFSLQTFYELWGVKTEEEARARIESQRYVGPIRNLEEQALALVGHDVYETLIRGYTEKQWGRPAVELPASIIKRLPLRFTFDTNYYSDKYQGVPVDGYTSLFNKILQGIPVECNIDYLSSRETWNSKAKYIIFTGCIDEFFNYRYGSLEYRSLEFTTETLEKSNYQGNAIINFTDDSVSYTRCIEHKFFNDVLCNYTVVTKEYPVSHVKDNIPYYPVPTEYNRLLYNRYADLGRQQTNVLFGGRLAEYKYMDMHVTIESALNKWTSFEKFLKVTN